MHPKSDQAIPLKGDKPGQLCIRLDRIRNAELRRLAAAHANRAFGLSLSLGCQRPLPLEENAAHA